MSLINVDTIKSRTGGPPTLSQGVVVSAAATFSGDVSIGGTLTYEDVTNVDVIGIVTARNGIKIGAAGIGGTIAANGNTTLAGVVTATSFSGAATGLTEYWWSNNRCISSSRWFCLNRYGKHCECQYC